jgi:CheY-like chemotaxis protein
MGKAKADEKPRVLIIEDSLDFANLLKFIVEDEGCEGVQFNVNDPDVVSVAKELKPVLILTDLALRRKPGFDYIKDLKADPATRKIPIAIISGRDLGHRELVELELQDVTYFRKGRVEMDEIKDAVRRSMGKDVQG